MSDEPALKSVQAVRVDDRMIDSAWRAEIRRRMERIKAGEVEWIDEEEILAELEADPEVLHDRFGPER
jgi:hypothetical protein